MVFILGVTGGIASGKTTVTDIFQSLGVDVVDADVVARNIVSLGSPALLAITHHFGEKILLESGELDRKQLRGIIFSQPEEKKWLEETLHPIVRKKIQDQLLLITSAYGILSSPLLFETQQDALVDRTLVVDCPAELQIARASKRDTANQQQIERMMQTQLSREERNLRADDIIMNEGGLAELTKLVNDYHHTLSASL